MKSLLAISWFFPPLLGARSIQVGKSLHTLANKGWDITVVTPDLKILPIGSILDETLLQVYGNKVRIKRIAAPRIMQLSQLIRKMIPSISVLPDDQMYWAKKVVDKVNLMIRGGNFQTMITFGHPWADHIIGERVKAATGISWVAHFSDPWANNPYHDRLNLRQQEKMRELEKPTVHSADKLVFTNQQTVDMVMSQYSASLRKKAHVIPHGFDKNAMVDFSKKAMKDKKKNLTFVHLGNIYRIRSPEPLFKAIIHLKSRTKILGNIRFVFKGAISSRAKWEDYLIKFGIQDYVSFEASVPYFESLAVGKAADVLLSIDANSAGKSVFLPSKLIDYLSLEKPILGISPEKGVVTDLLNALGMPVAPPSNPEKIAEEIEKIYQQWVDKSLDLSSKFSKISQQYEIETTTGNLEKILLELDNAE